MPNKFDPVSYAPASARIQPRWPEPILWAAVFFPALLFRLIYLSQLSHVPSFTSPLGDSQIYCERARQILAGHFFPPEVYFHSSPPYPYFIALIWKFFGISFGWLGMAQILIGSLDCVLIYELGKQVGGGNRWAGLMAGWLAAAYALLAFFDADWLMIFMTLPLLNASLLLLLRSRQSRSMGAAVAAGLCFGLSALDKTNLLLFAPVAAFFLANGFSLKTHPWHAGAPAAFLITLALSILPVTAINARAGQDWVLVSSNAGVNLFIGNNPSSPGTFMLPQNSGLSNIDFYESQKAVAEKAAGRTLKPSAVSRYWAARAWRWVFHHPAQALRLYWQKFRMLWNHYEIPNHINFYYVRNDFTPVLGWMIAGFGGVVPLALAGLVWLGVRGRTTPAYRLYFAFLLVFQCSLLPFFITERYRLPMIPVLIAFAGVFFVEAAKAFSQKNWRLGGSLVLGAGLIAGLVNSPPPVLMTFAHNRVGIGGKYLETALQNKQQGSLWIQKAIVELKQALETEPSSVDAHYNLARSYEAVGFYSGALTLLEYVIKADPIHPMAAAVLTSIREKFQATGDRISAESLPLTPFEQARRFFRLGNPTAAEALCLQIIRQDPFHLPAVNELGFYYFRQSRYAEAAETFKKGLAAQPKNFALLNNLAGTYFKLDKLDQAAGLYRSCLHLEPNNPLILKQLQTLERRRLHPQAL